MEPDARKLAVVALAAIFIPIFAINIDNDVSDEDEEPISEYDFDHCLLWLRSNGYDQCRPSAQFAQLDMDVGSADDDDDRLSILPKNKCCPDDYPDIGCFSRAQDTPWRCDITLPDCPRVVGPRFLVYTPEMSMQAQEVDYLNLNATIRLLQMSSQRPFVAISHGFGKKWPKKWMFNMKDRLTTLGNNVLILNWTGGSGGPNYFKAASNTRSVGIALALVMKALHSQDKIYIQDSTIVGFSLGAHVAGSAGKNLPNLKRIIGLDPAGPMFQCMDAEARLDKSDAKFVQVIHTNGEYFLKGGEGTMQPMGHMDVYVNGGVRQPGCPRDLLRSVAPSLQDLNFTQIKNSVSCSHMRMPQLFVEMLENQINPGKSCRYYAFPCANPDDFSKGSCFQCPKGGHCPVAGIATDLANEVKGQFFLNTLAENSTTGQFCGRQYLLSLVSDTSFKGQVSIIAKMRGLQSPEIYFQKKHDSMIGGLSKKIVAVVPWAMTSIEKLQIFFAAHANGVNYWTLESVSIQSIAGETYVNNRRVKVQSGIKTIVHLQQQQEL